MASENEAAPAVVIEDCFFAEQPEDAEADAAALDHEVSADHPILGQAAGDRPALHHVPSEVGVRGDYRRNAASLGGHADGLAQTIRSEVEIMVAEGDGFVTHQGHELQFGAGLARGGGERGPHAVVARVKDQHRTQILARLFPLRDHRGQTHVPTQGLVVVTGRERGIVRGPGPCR